MQPVSGAEYRKFAAVGTTVVRDSFCVLKNLFIPATATGTLSIYDVATAAGTAAGNLVFTIPNIQGTPLLYNFDWRLKTGMVVVAVGAANFTLGIN